MDHNADHANVMTLPQSADRPVVGIDDEMHATTAGAAAAGAVTGGVIGLTGGPIGAAIGALGGAIVGVAAERMMHGDDGPTLADVANEAHYVNEAHVPTTDVPVVHTDADVERYHRPERAG